MRKLLHNRLSDLVQLGCLELVYANGELHTYGTPEAGTTPPRLRFADHAAERAVMWDPELRFGELFAEGRIIMERGSIFDVLMVLGHSHDSRPPSVPAWLLTMVRVATRRLRQLNTPRSARTNVAKHYDLDSGLYELFLDPDHQYSCAYFESPDLSLAAAQLAKKRRIAAKLALQPALQVLDIGSGWGGLGIYLAQHAGADVTGVTLSEHQHQISNARAAELGLRNQVHFNLQDYRHVDGQFDRIVSVGMFEHVGVGYYRTFFAKCRQLLRDNGVILLHTIGKLEPPGGTNPWIQKYIFPGGYIPALSEVTTAIEREGLRVTDLEVWRNHYALTLRHWRQRFLARRDTAVEMFGEKFCRIWEFYLAACEMAFVHRNLAVFQFQLTRRLDALPITRRYMGETEARLRAQDTESPGT